MSEVAQSCLTPCDPMDYSLPGSSVHGIFQARILEWVAICTLKFAGLLSQKGCGQDVFLTDLSFSIWAAHWSLLESF